jgi:urease accessory protein
MHTNALDPTALLTLAQWLSPAFPTGAFAWSHGIETADLPDAAAFEDYLGCILDYGSGRNDTILLAAAWRDPGAAGEIDALARAWCPSSGRLAETVEQGTAFAAAVNAGWDLDVAPAALPVAIGVAARARDLPLDPTARLALHAFAANLTGAATRAIPLGQAAAQAVLARHAVTVNAVVDAALTESLDDLGGAAIMADIAAMRHETRHSRIFRS